MLQLCATLLVNRESVWSSRIITTIYAVDISVDSVTPTVHTTVRAKNERSSDLDFKRYFATERKFVGQSRVGLVVTDQYHNLRSGHFRRFSHPYRAHHC